MTPPLISADFPFTHRFVEVHGSRMAYVDEGQGDPLLFLHGNPTSSYLWRNILPHVKGLGRCIAPDLIGMGRSDKPDLAYRFADHARYLDGFISALGLERITLVLHDWGSALGLDWAMRNEDKVQGLAFMEAFLSPLSGWEQFPAKARDLFRAFRTPGVGESLVLDQNVFVEKVLPGSVVRGLTPEELAHYRAPFPDRASRRPTLAWPNEIPIDGHPADVADIVVRYREALRRSPLPKLLFAVEPGVLLPPPLVAWCRENLPRLEVIELGQGLHYIQEDHPHAIGQGLADWLRRQSR
ncbi:haloalkane dehalogenase [Myxococcus stipitatus DSM 14675]|uniref:Haloalkane dehalogenase n=1 Tax=Myxococcus stipitatus (strain DSM 14675 / JCM 12634 / Mx s8) TaxID=1278073 RepID=L7UF81_MYXSD|nr:haloalkane dehalogenase [Myxococcus stipitatus]AGC46698.1 haloalkane dehalogenase [Myxococcus stipitatus DSM 14675]